MEKNNNIKIMGVFASILLLVIVITASFAYFGSFNVNLNNNVAVNVNSVSPGNATFTSNATQLNLQVPAANMSQTVSDNETAAASNTAILTVNLTGASDLITICTYDIVYEYDADSYIYGGSQTKSAAKNGDKEITLQVSNVNGTNNFSNEKNFDYDSSWSNNKRTLVSGATITSNGVLTSQNISITAKYYNLNISQSSLEGHSFTGKIFITNNKCDVYDGLPFTVLMSTMATDVYEENGLRFEGTNPNNYICLDNNKGGTCSDNSLLFRIIGLFDEDTLIDETNSAGIKPLLKVIDTNNYGSTSGNKWGSNNNWSISPLKSELNNTYLTTLLSNLNVNSKLYISIANAKWHLGGVHSNYSSAKVAVHYRRERNTDAIYVYGSNPSSIYAKVGLMYPSDYGYATVGGTTTNKSSCREKSLEDWSSSLYSDCKNNDWLFTSQSNFANDGEWFISPISDDSTKVTSLRKSGFVHINLKSPNLYSVRPTFYLDAEILKIVGGNGSSSNPYRIG